MAFSATEAAFEGFRIARERPLAIAIWAAVSLVFSILMGVGLVTLLGADLDAITQMSTSQPTTDPAEALAMLEKVGKLYLVAVPLALLSMAVFSAAVYRVVLRPADSAFGYLRVGGDEVRLILLFVIMGLLWIVGMTLVILAVAILAAVVSGGQTATPGFFGGFLVFLGFVGAFCAGVWVAVRLSLAGPMTFAEGKLRIFESWKVTQGRFWPLFGAYLLAMVLGIMVSLLGWVVIAAASAVVGGGFSAVGAVMKPDYSTLEAYFTPATIIYLAVSSILSALYYAIILAPPAVAYRELAARNEASVF